TRKTTTMQTQWNIEIPESPLESKVNEDTPNEVLWSKIRSELPWLKSESELPSSKSKKSPSKSRKSPPNINLLNYHVRRYTRGLEKWVVGDGNMSLSVCFVERFDDAKNLTATTYDGYGIIFYLLHLYVQMI
ncbi:hypothetical protein Tco_1421287, partial [Tanacetum coccineum]